MKKFLSLILVLCMIFCVAGCGESKTDVSKTETSEGRTLSPEQKYNSAIKHVQRTNYDRSIKLLEEVPDYKDSKDILGKVHYIYGSELFNKQNFTEAYTHFQKASGFSDVDQRRSMVDYYGGIYLTNQGEYVSALTYFKRAIDSDYVKEATIYVSELTGNLLSGGWIGSTNMNNVTLQVEMSYTKIRNTFSLIWADRSNGGYRHVTNMDYGTLSILGSRAAFEYEGSLYTVEFDFYSATSVNVKWSNEKLNGMAGGIFNRNNAAIFEYKIPNVTYPTMTIPELFAESSSDSENSAVSSEENSSSSEEPTISSEEIPSSLENTDPSSKENSNSSEKSATSSKFPTSSIKNTSNNKKPTQNTAVSEKEHVHDFTIKATCEEPAKCNCGETSGLATGHDWEYATCEKPEFCNNCGKTNGEALGHNWEDATCTTPKHCDICDKKEGEALGHKYNSDKTVVCQECEEFRSNADSLIKSIPINILEPDNTYIVTQSITSAAITNYYNPSEKYFEIEIKVKGEYLLTFNGGGCTFYAFDKSNNKIATQSINTGGGNEGSEFTCKATLTLPTDIDGINLAVE